MASDQAGPRKDVDDRSDTMPRTADLLFTRAAQLSPCGLYRWTLTRVWDSALPRVCFIGHNPSTADHLIDDPTVRRWTHFTRAWGYGGFIAVNLYPFRAADPDACRRWADWEKNGPDWYARDAIQQNFDVVAMEAKAAGLVVACWGNLASDEMLVEHVIEHIMDGEEPWPSVHVFGLTKSGAPIHPMARGKMRDPDDRSPVVWRGASGA